MKLHSLLLVALLGSSASAQAPAQLPVVPAPQAAITQEVLQVAHQMIVAAEKLDLDGVLKLCADGPDFAFTQPDGKTFRYAEMKKAGAEIFGPLSSQKMITQKEKVIVLTPDAALYLWWGCNDLFQKDGKVLRADPYASLYLFRKLNGRWLFILGQDSALPFAPIKEGPASEK